MKEIGFLAIGLGMFMLIYFTATKDTKIPAVETVNLPEIKIGSQIWSPPILVLAPSEMAT